MSGYALQNQPVALRMYLRSILVGLPQATVLDQDYANAIKRPFLSGVRRTLHCSVGQLCIPTEKDLTRLQSPNNKTAPGYNKVSLVATCCLSLTIADPATSLSGLGHVHSGIYKS